MDSNHRSRKTADLQSAPFGHSGICPNSCHYFRKRICDNFTHSRHPINVGASCRIRTNDPEITNHVLWPTELKRQRHLCAVTVVKRVQMYGFFLNYKTFSTFFSKNRRKISFFPSKQSTKQGEPVRKSPIANNSIPRIYRSFALQK